MRAAVEQAHSRRVLQVLIDSMDDFADGEELARRAHFGRYYFNHLVKAAFGESPGALRRRLLLERAADQLASTGRSVTSVAVGSGYGSVEAFAHAFRRAYGVSPAEYRSRPPLDHRLPAPNGVHFVPPGGTVVPGDDGRRRPMNLTDRLVAHDNWLMERLLICAAKLSDWELDEPVVLSPPSAAFDGRAPSIRAMLDDLVRAKELWVRSIVPGDVQPLHDTSVAGMRRRSQETGATFAQLVYDIGRRDAWDTAYLDARLDPPGTNTFGASVAHVLARAAARHEIVVGALLARGIDPGALDPVQWELGPTAADGEPVRAAG